MASQKSRDKKAETKKHREKSRDKKTAKKIINTDMLRFILINTVVG